MASTAPEAAAPAIDAVVHERSPPVEDEGDGSVTVLVREDADAIRPLLERALEEVGYRVLLARGADEALRLAQAESIDLLVTDPEALSVRLLISPMSLAGKSWADALGCALHATKYRVVSGLSAARGPPDRNVTASPRPAWSTRWPASPALRGPGRCAFAPHRCPGSDRRADMFLVLTHPRCC